MLDVCIFNVGLGQCIFLRPAENNAEYSTLIDCGSHENFKPVDFIAQYLPFNSRNQRNLKNLTLTNYDEDHFSGICDLINRVNIETIAFSKNLTSDEIRKSKTRETPTLNSMLDLKDRYTGAISYWNPPYTKTSFHLQKTDLGDTWDTNNLSMLTFIDYKGFVICIPGDLEQKGWEQILKNSDVIPFLQRTQLFIASHHGRENGYYSKVFNYCKPQCVIISDDSVQCGTQENMSSVYAGVINGNGILLDSAEWRKVLTTRYDGHILVKINDAGYPTYHRLNING